MQLQKGKKLRKKEIHNQLPLFTSTPHLYIQKIMQPEERKVCRLFPFSSSLEDRRARIIKKRKNVLKWLPNPHR